MSSFQVIVGAIFFVFILISVLLFAGVIPGFRSSSGGSGGEVVIWGTMSQKDTRGFFEDVNREYKDSFRITYVQKNVVEYESDLVQALAAGVGPDLFFLPHDLILKHQDKVTPIPFESVSERRFQDTFLEEGELFITQEGILAFPLLVDPLVMYWNRDLFSQAGIAQPPVYWDELFSMVPKLTKNDQAGNITQSGVALGTFTNIQNAKGILSALTLQTRNPIVERTAEYSAQIVFGNQDQRSRAESALRFYTQFANPSNQLYAWNPSLDSAREAFTAETLAMYFGYASELDQIITKNPHLNFDVAVIPQIRDENSKRTYGTLTGLAISRQSKNPQTALQVMNVLTNRKNQSTLSNIIGLPPVRRDLLSEEPSDAFQSTFYDAAIITDGWLDPQPERTYNIFSDMVSSITSGRKSIGSAVGDAQTQLETLIK